MLSHFVLNFLMIAIFKIVGTATILQLSWLQDFKQLFLTHFWTDFLD